MDVGLNNRNNLGEIAPEFADVVFFVEANSNEQLMLWQEWSKKSRYNIEALANYVIMDITPINVRKLVKELNDKIKDVTNKRVDWKEVGLGFSLKIGELDNRPVVVSFHFAFINEKKICFYDCVSQVVDHKMIENWLMKRFQLTHDGYTRRNHTNAMNFHNCVKGLENLDKEPRDTVYKYQDQ